MRIGFNPFNVDFMKLEVSNLETLKNVAEGWYVEYKSQLTSPKKIAKSLAAFANHYGGWLFYGIMESQDQSNFAGSFPGIKKSQIPKCLEDIRNAARNSINPTPYFESRILEGPCPEIGLSDECSIIVVLIPIGKDAPYIHSDGRVYRRVADSSDPKPETDRFILDNLSQRRKIANEELSSFLKKRPIDSKKEDETSFLHLYLMSDPLGISGRYVDLSFEKFKEFMTKPETTGIEIAFIFDNIFTMSNGFVARHISINDPYNLVLTWHYYLDGSALVTIPLSSISISEHPSSEFINYFKGYNETKNVLEEIERQRLKSGRLLDINNLFYTVFAIVGQYKKLISESKLEGPVYTKAALKNIWRRIPFFDTPTYVKHIKESGFSLIQFNEEFAPPGDTFESMRIIKDRNKADLSEVKGINQILEAGPLMGDIGSAVGLPGKVLFDSNVEWLDAANRAMNKTKKQLEKFFDDY